MDEQDDCMLHEPDLLTGTAPDRIWLQVDATDDDRSMPYPTDHDGVTWCWESIGGAEIGYIRSDLVLAVLPENWRDDADWLRLAPLLGIAT